MSIRPAFEALDQSCMSGIKPGCMPLAAGDQTLLNHLVGELGVVNSTAIDPAGLLSLAL